MVTAISSSLDSALRLSLTYPADTLSEQGADIHAFQLAASMRDFLFLTNCIRDLDGA